jgi:hypothetical protein
LSLRARAAMPQDPAMRKSSPSACVAFMVDPPSPWGGYGEWKAAKMMVVSRSTISSLGSLISSLSR